MVETQERLPTGISGFDEVLTGGLIPERAYLVRGGPGTGKTTLGFHFLCAPSAAEEQRLFITLGEPEAQLRTNAEQLGFKLEGLEFLEMSPTAEYFAEQEVYTLFSPADVEGESSTSRLVAEIERLKPERIFIDSMTPFRFLVQDTTQFRKQTLSFLRFLVGQGATVLFASESGPDAPDDDLQYLADGVIHLRYHPTGRGLEVTKLRGSDFRPGRHSFELTSRGMEVYPKLIPESHTVPFAIETISSGVPALDQLLNGGLDRGTTTILTGPAGVGKTTLGCLYLKESAGRGERSVLYAFEEATGTLLHRTRSINLPFEAMLERGTLKLEKVEPLQYSPDQLAAMVREEVEERGAKVVMLDGIAGYRLSVRGEGLVSHLHALCRYLTNMGVTVILINELEMITGDFRATEVGVSYLADTIVFLRYVEVAGQLRRAIGVLKKRTGDFEKALREFEITRYGIRVGDPMSNVQGLMTGAPVLLPEER